MVLDERALGLADSLFDRMQLLGNVYALTSVLDHRNDAAQMPICPFQALDDRLMALVSVSMPVFGIMRVIMGVIGHILSLSRRYITLEMLSPPGGWVKHVALLLEQPDRHLDVSSFPVIDHDRRFGNGLYAGLDGARLGGYGQRGSTLLGTLVEGTQRLPMSPMGNPKAPVGGSVGM